MLPVPPVLTCEPCLRPLQVPSVLCAATVVSWVTRGAPRKLASSSGSPRWQR